MSDLAFSEVFKALTGKAPFPWLEALYSEFAAGQFPHSVTLPTGLGKTSVIAVWLVALADHPDRVPRRLAYVVNRRTVVDQSTDFTKKLREQLSDPRLKALRERLSALATATEDSPLAISTLRGQFADNGEWWKDPARPAVIVGTIDLIGSRLLFSGYRAGYKTRPMFAGFLGQDTLLVHDEAHLEPAYQSLLAAIRAEQQCRPDFRPLYVMALTATARDESSEEPFRLTPQDLENQVVQQRIHAKKTLVLHSVEETAIVPRMIELALAHKDSGQAVLIFARTVKAVHEIRRGLVGKDKVSADQVMPLTGTMRGWERDQMADGNKVFARFRPDAPPSDGPRRTVYLVCTAAGEVGVDISADHLVCDLTPFDSMAQRFGRVNRYGYGNAQIDVVHEAKPKEKKKGGEFDERRWLTRQLLSDLKGDASPAALGALPAAEVQEAFTPTPEILPTSDILFDAWTMTTIRDRLPGRPPVADWLHGVPEEWQPPETYVAWRQEVWELRHVFLSEEDRRRWEAYAEDLLDDYPLKPHELLRDSTDRVFEALEELAEEFPSHPVWVIDTEGAVVAMTLGEVVGQDKARLSGRTVLLPPQVGGLTQSGMLGTDDVAERLDIADEWRGERGEPRRLRLLDDEPDPPELESMRLVRTVELPVADAEGEGGTEEGQRRIWRWYVRPWSADDDGSRSAPRAQKLEHHLEAAERFARNISTRLTLPSALIEAVALAARWHDRGKSRELWQRSIGNSDYPRQVLAKSGSKAMRITELSHYRHEFGSLLEADAEFRDHPERDLILHLIATHHGRGRPHFPAEEAFDPDHPDVLCAEVAREVPRRFARLQRRFGRWGLAYLESLLRAADYLASVEVAR